ncbi:MAG: hypothetical protein A2Z04_00910 [Chloroflexi bacterium RBG_16_57_9]|nr:MAG: hypothetical protein A2Z04_00910 [Chloroflexi bacterium RBG_16_57_9]
MDVAIDLETSAPSRLMTEEEFESWCDEDVKAEWIEGEIIVHSPATPQHSEIDNWLIKVVGLFVDRHDLGKVLGPEVQIRIPGRRRVPDLIFVPKARQEMIRRTYVQGAPDLVMEIVSPDSLARDWREKYLEYESAGVREYWVIDPVAQHLEVYGLTEAGRYTRLPEESGVIRSQVLPGFWLRVDWLWQEPLPNSLEVLRELAVI